MIPLTPPASVSISRLPQLPNELYHEIFKHIDSNRDLCALSVASRNMQPRAEHFIWRSIRSKDRQRTKFICDIVTSCSRLHHLVHSFTIANETGPFPNPETETWHSIAKALRCLPNLEVLKIQDGYEELNGWIFDDCPFLLKELTCPFLLDKLFTKFLQTQVRITAFLGNALGQHDCFSLLGPQFLPALQLLRIDLVDTASNLLPDRPVTHLWINLTYDVSECFLACIPALGRSTGPLRAFRMSFPFQKGKVLALLAALASHTPLLRSLGFLHQFSRNDRDIIDAIARFDHLNSLVMWNLISNDTIKAVAEACPSLRFVACLHYSYSHEYMVFPVNNIGRPRPVHDPEFLLWKDA